MSVAADGLAARTYVALLHYPVYDKRRRVVATAITNLDIHDIARACRTFGLGGFYLTTPIAAQRELGSRIIGHWRNGFGAVYNERRKEALDRVTIACDLEDVRARVREHAGAEPLTCATCARTSSRSPAMVTTSSASLRRSLYAAPKPPRQWPMMRLPSSRCAAMGVVRKKPPSPKVRQARAMSWMSRLVMAVATTRRRLSETGWCSSAT